MEGGGRRIDKSVPTWERMLRLTLSLCLALLLVYPAEAQHGRKTITGTVVTQNTTSGEIEPVAGASILVEGDTRGVTTDISGRFSIDVAETDKLIVMFLGMEQQIIPVAGRNNLKIELKEKQDELESVTVVAFAKQRKESVVSSVSTISPKELKGPTSNLTTMLAGRVAGMISYQRSGEPGADNAQFFIRGVTSFGYKRDPLILIDGIELSTNDLARLQPDDIESFSILKDATSAAVYGSRGANGVILVQTKQGHEGPARISVRVENSLSTPVRKLSIADPITFMQLHNEAVSTRDPLATLPYSQGKVDNTIKGINPYVYPAVDWYKMLFKDYTNNQRVNMNIRGGSKLANYYVAAAYDHDSGIIKSDNRNKFKSNIDINRLSVRSNIGLDITKTTNVMVRMYGSFRDYSGPLDSGTELYHKALRSNPVLFPAYYAPDEANMNTRHILFGNNDKGTAINPYADLMKGYKESKNSLMTMQGEVKQDLRFITQGLSAKLLFNTTRNSYFEATHAYTPYWYRVANYDRGNNSYTLENTNPNDGREFLTYDPQTKQQRVMVSTYIEALLNYSRTFGERHEVGALLVYTMKSQSQSNAETLQKSLPYRNIGLAGRITYGYDSRYFIEGNFGYNGSERFAKKHRFGFFPSVGLGWMISNERFFERLKNTVSTLKLRGSYGQVGNDAIGDINDRFFYLSQVEIKEGSIPGFGENMDSPSYRPEVAILRYANDCITWEISNKLDVGVDLTLFNSLTLQAEYFREHRTNILMSRSSTTPEMGLEVDPSKIRANLGEARSHGVDLSLDYNKAFRNGLWIQGRANFTYATGRYNVYEEPEYTDAPWLNHRNQPITQQWGYVAERLFIDETEVANSPTQFGTYMAGDIKYKDINGDGVINFKDRVPIGYPTTPEIMYGFGFSLGYKGFDISAFFQGSARSSFWISPVDTAPFVGSPNSRAMLQVYADNHWSEANQNPYALWPRLSASVVENNNLQSTWFMQDGSFMRLKSFEIGYTFTDTVLRKSKIRNLRIYLSGTNLFTISKFKLWDPEMAGNGLGYPVQRVFNIGLQISL